MTGDIVLKLAAELLWSGLLLSAPVLGTTLVVGLLVGMVQVVTQLSEMSLAFVPKLLAVGAVLVVAGPWMLQVLCRFALQMWQRIPGAAT